MLRNAAGDLVTFVFANETQLQGDDDADKENVVIQEEDLEEEAALEKELKSEVDSNCKGKDRISDSEDEEGAIDLGADDDDDDEEDEEEEDGDYNGEEEEEEGSN